MPACAAHPELLSIASCHRCQAPVCGTCESKLDGASYCRACVDQLSRMLGRPLEGAPAGAAPITPAAPANLGLGVAAAAAAGLVGALVWFGVVVVTDFKVGLLAVGIGWLIGFAAMKAAGGPSPALPWISLAIALAAMVGGEYLIVNHFVTKAAGDPGLAFIPFDMFLEVYGRGFNPMDLLFYAIGAWEAYKLPARALRAAA